MKQVSFYFAALAMLALTACSSDSNIESGGGSSVLTEQEQVPVSFGTYLGNLPKTRAQQTGDMTNELLKSAGFGVFAYYTNDTDYPASNNAYDANFMYNQKVTGTTTGEATTWSYSPIKYWPNDFSSSAVDDQTTPAQGSSTYGGKISFFAYAPHVSDAASGETTYKLDPSTGTFKDNSNAYTGTGIVSMTSNEAQADPIITYKINYDNPASNVDLLWGTAGKGTASSYTPAAGSSINGKQSSVTYKDGETDKYYYVWKDCIKQKIGGNLEFSFYHAFAKIGNITVKVNPNTDAGSDNSTFGNTITENKTTTNVTVSSITISYNDYDSKTFNLATGMWGNVSGATSTSHTYTFNSADNMNTDLYYGVGGINSTNEPSNGDGENNTKSQLFGKLPVGADATTAKSVFKSGSAPLLLIYPTSTSTTMSVSVTYTLRTYDESLKLGWTSVPQTITKDLTFSNGFAMNTNYTINILLGIEDVNFTATYKDWDTESSVDVNLPINVGSGS